MFINMNNKIQSLSQIDNNTLIESIEYNKLFYSKRSFGTKVEMDGVEYVFYSEEFDDLDKMIDNKRVEIISQKRDDKISIIVDDK